MTFMHHLTFFFRIKRKLVQIIMVRLNPIKFAIYGIKLGKRACIYNHVYLHVHPKSNVTIGDSFTMTSGDNFNPLCRNIKGCIYLEREDTIIKIGNHVGMSSTCLWAKREIVIDDYVNIGGDCIIMDSDAHNLDWRVRDSGEMFDTKTTMDVHTAVCKPIHICSHVLIGARTIVLKGVTIGRGSVIAAGSVVTKSIPENVIAGGNPCRIIKEINTSCNPR